jgi:hypothetical protein
MAPRQATGAPVFLTTPAVTPSTRATLPVPLMPLSVGRLDMMASCAAVSLFRRPDAIIESSRRGGASLCTAVCAAFAQCRCSDSITQVLMMIFNQNDQGAGGASGLKKMARSAKEGEGGSGNSATCSRL